MKLKLNNTSPFRGLLLLVLMVLVDMNMNGVEGVNLPEGFPCRGADSQECQPYLQCLQGPSETGFTCQGKSCWDSEDCPAFGLEIDVKCLPDPKQADGVYTCQTICEVAGDTACRQYGQLDLLCLSNPSSQTGLTCQTPRGFEETSRDDDDFPPILSRFLKALRTVKKKYRRGGSKNYN